MARNRKEKTEFGAYLVKAISDADMSQADFIAEVGIARPYFYDILKNSPPPKETLEKMLGVLEKLIEKLGEITGETANEKIIDKIFSKFCLGK